MLTVVKHGLYLTRNARQVGIARDRGEGEQWRWLTTAGYYVLADGRAALIGESVKDLVRDLTPTPAQCEGADSMFGQA